MEYIEIKEQIKQKLPVARDLGDSENLLELGLSSLTIMRLVNQWRKQGVKVSFGSLMENPTLEGWWALIQRSMKKITMFERVKEIIEEQLNLDGVEITEASRFKEDLQADSLDLFELVMAFEDEYGVEIPSEDLEKITTVGSVIEYMKAKGVEA